MGAPMISSKAMKSRLPEVLAPAGDHASLEAALAAGADSVYLGLDDGFNARARAKNFDIDGLPDLVRKVHRAGARLYLTLNTLVFEPELPLLEELLRKIAVSGVDALIVQDPAVCLIARRLSERLELHASTQMTISSPEGARFAMGLGVTRVVLPRELSVDEIRTYRELAPRLGVDHLELEVFVHGALCMSWSGQCLTSEAWGGRSANRGQCAQSCRLPYGLEVDGEPRHLEKDGDALRYFLSPKDLAGHRSVPALVELGVHTLKIEGRLKGPSYVRTAVESFSRWLDAIHEGRHEGEEAQRQLADDLSAAHRVYSRGFTDGFLAGPDHQSLVDGRHPKNRGRFLGKVRKVDVNRREVVVWPAPDFPVFIGALPDHTPPEAPLVPQRGMGVVFDAHDPEDPKEAGGPIFDVAPEANVANGWVLRFGDPGPDLSRVKAGQRVWVNSDPAIESETRKLLARPVTGRVAATLGVSGQLGGPISATLSAGGVEVTELGPTLEVAKGQGLDDGQLAEKLGGFGGTRFFLARLDNQLPSGLFASPSELKALRRRLVERLEASLDAPPAVVLPETSVVEALKAAQRAATEGRPYTAERLENRDFDEKTAQRAAAEGRPYTAERLENRDFDERAPQRAATEGRPYPDQANAQGRPHPAERLENRGIGDRLVPLCRLPHQLEVAIALGFREVELDWMEMVGLGRAVERARAAGLKVTVATTRVQKPGEEGFDQRIAKLNPDAVLARHWGALVHFNDRRSRHESGPLVHGDFSLNVTNSLTAHHLFGLGCDTLTASHDLDEAQLFALLDEVPAHRMAVVVHHHIPTFHTEHCVYAATLSNGKDYRTCGRPCDTRQVSLVDPKGLAHPVITDVGCRNTVFEARAQSAASLVPKLIERGIGRLRVELVRETEAETRVVLESYRELVLGRLSPREVVRRVGVHEQFGVVRGVARSVGDAALAR